MHPVVLKPVTTHKNFLVHDGAEQCVVGDWVRIDSCRKFSKNKNFTLGEIVKPASRFFEQETGILHSQASVNVKSLFKQDEYKQPSIFEQQQQSSQ
ncbi:hypothetical protein BCR33DRAFT_720653 [Rhizoclosmatium globosum]|uniref:Uncharacterized protein n=1 Tax=Rhizoclosmatium globosum TaxID=329046 RepID=A0A1Y2BV79_9FUNG|nr:hypothetical protein BCR33DRAFT_720653 [Rhizoclosmatium globosum]|eukprot:ORY38643.1 hypothetical protein BCR33DRAFT_720653 [Rhizoclosmatium globosum]